MLEGFQLHLVRRRPFAGEDRFPLQIAVHHENDRLIVCQISYDDRNLFNTRQLAGAEPAMTGDHFISAVRVRPDNGGI